MSMRAEKNVDFIPVLSKIRIGVAAKLLWGVATFNTSGKSISHINDTTSAILVGGMVAYVQGASLKATIAVLCGFANFPTTKIYLVVKT